MQHDEHQSGGNDAVCEGGYGALCEGLGQMAPFITASPTRHVSVGHERRRPPQLLRGMCDADWLLCDPKSRWSPALLMVTLTAPLCRCNCIIWMPESISG